MDGEDILRIIIGLRYRAGKVHIETKLDQGCKDKVSEINAGQALYDTLCASFSELNGDGADKAKEVN